MIRFTKLTARNFLSIGQVTQALNLDEYGLTLVLGHNPDATGTAISRNGAGKSTIIQALSYALYGQPISRIRVDNLVNNVNNKGMFVSVEFEKEGVTYRIERGRKPTFLKYYVNGAEQKEKEQTQGENRHTQEEIERVIGMSHTLFKHLVALNTYTEPFLRMRPGEQREIIEELLMILQISRKAEILKKMRDETKERIKIEEGKIAATKETNARIEAAIQKAELERDAWERDHNIRLHELEEGIEGLDSIDFDAEIAAFNKLDEWLNKERELHSEIDRANREITFIDREIKSLEATIKSKRSEASGDRFKAQAQRILGEADRAETDAANYLKRAEASRNSAAEIQVMIDNPNSQICECCGQPLTGTDHLQEVIARLSATLKGHLADAERFENEAAKLTTKAKGLREEVSQVETEATNRIKLLEQEAADAEKKAEKLRKERNDLVANVETHKEALSALGPKPETLFPTRDEAYRARHMRDSFIKEIEAERAKTNPHVPHIELLKGTLQEINYDTLNDLTSQLAHEEFLLKLLTSKDSFIRKKIIDQNLSYLNGRLSFYLEKLGLPHEVRFMPDLSVEIMLLGREFDFEQLSRGEMNRVILATSWAFRDIWESANTSINLLFVDELADQGMDAHGADGTLAVLKSMARDRGKNVFLISHRDDMMARTDTILLVSKNDGFTTFETNASVS